MNTNLNNNPKRYCRPSDQLDSTKKFVESLPPNREMKLKLIGSKLLIAGTPESVKRCVARLVKVYRASVKVLPLSPTRSETDVPTETGDGPSGQEGLRGGTAELVQYSDENVVSML
jgi:hypothetical protein